MRNGPLPGLAVWWLPVLSVSFFREKAGWRSCQLDSRRSRRLRAPPSTVGSLCSSDLSCKDAGCRASDQSGESHLRNRGVIVSAVCAPASCAETSSVALCGPTGPADPPSAASKSQARRCDENLSKLEAFDTVTSLQSILTRNPAHSVPFLGSSGFAREARV